MTTCDYLPEQPHGPFLIGISLMLLILLNVYLGFSVIWRAVDGCGSSRHGLVYNLNKKDLRKKKE